MIDEFLKNKKHVYIFYISMHCIRGSHICVSPKSMWESNKSSHSSYGLSKVYHENITTCGVFQYALCLAVCMATIPQMLHLYWYLELVFILEKNVRFGGAKQDFAADTTVGHYTPIAWSVHVYSWHIQLRNTENT